jgi:hypothetical protein
MKKLSFLLILSLSMLIVSCEKEKKFAEFTTEYNSYAFNDNGESITVNVSANSEWT